MQTLNDITDQTGTLIFDYQGIVSNATGEFTSETGDKIASIILSMLQDTSNIMLTKKDTNTSTSPEAFERLIINFASCTYLVTMDKSQIYVVKKK